MSRRLRIGIDASQASIEMGRGLRRYLLHLLKTLPLSSAPHRYFFITSESAIAKSFVPSDSQFKCVHPRRYFALRRWPWLAAAKFFAPRTDLMHFINTLWDGYRGKCVVTLGDLAPYHFPDNLFVNKEEENIYHRQLKIIVDRATLIATHSEYSRQDLIAHLKISPARVRTVYPIVDPVFLDARPEPRKPEEPYFLYVGGIDFRKNIPLLLDAFSLYRERGGRSKLILVGRRENEKRPKHYPPLQPLLDAMKEKKHVRWLTRISDEELVSLYAASNAFVFPSFFEGFGSPLVEAMACGTPVITVRKTCIPEVMGEAAYYVETAPESLADAMADIESNAALRRQLVESGKERLKLYQPERFAEEMVSVYEDAARL